MRTRLLAPAAVVASLPDDAELMRPKRRVGPAIVGVKVHVRGTVQDRDIAGDLVIILRHAAGGHNDLVADLHPLAILTMA